MKPKKPQSKFRRLLTYIRPQWYYFVIAVLGGLYKFLLPSVMVWLLGDALDVIINYSKGLVSLEAAWHRVLWMIVIGGIFLILSPLPVYIRSLFANKGTNRSILALRCDLFQHIYKLSHSFFERNQTGSLVSRIIGDIENVSSFISNALITIWMHLGRFVIIIVFLFLKNPLLTGVALSLIPVQIILFNRLSRKIEQVSKNVRHKTARLAGNTQEKLAGVTIVKTFTSEPDEIRRFREDSDQLVEESDKAGHLSGVSQAVIQFLNNLGPLMIMFSGAYLALFYPAIVTIGSFVQFAMLQQQLYSPISYLSNTIVIFAEAMGALDRIFQLLDLEPDIQDNKKARPAPVFDGEIVFENVGFAYSLEGSRVISSLNFTLPPRSTTALVGESGGGKTTIANLLNRFYDIHQGSIRIDGVDIRDYQIRSLRSRIALVPQDPVLFSGTIRENVLYGWPQASEAALEKAVCQAYASEFILRLPDGLDTILGERGVNLSGGQKQRLAIARAFLKDPSILILDEATSALDAESETMVQQALNDLLRERTTIIIAHRLSTVMKADRILVIEGGQIVEQGTHQQLYALERRYYQLCKHQFEAATDSCS